MPSYTLAKLQAEMVNDEGLKTKPYRDTVGKLTIGIGRNLDDRGITKEEAYFLLSTDIEIAESDLDKNTPWWRDLSDARQRAILNMCMNLGWPRLSGFAGMRSALKTGDYERAATESEHSLWASQVGSRAQRIGKLLKDG